MLNPSAVYESWLVNTADPLNPPPRVQAAIRQMAREEKSARDHWLDFQPDALEGFLELVDQGRLEFSDDDAHANVRMSVGRFLDAVVLPRCADPKVRKLPSRLREARRNGTVLYRHEDQRFITIWDTKAGLPLLCPDDAREEAMRLQRRYVPTLAEWKNSGKALHTGVLTLPNFEPGKLRQGMQQIFKRFRALLKSGKFPEIVGALCTLEAPLGRCRDWNVHLNIMLMCDGYLDYGKLRELWHWDIDIKRVRVDPRQNESFEDAVKRSLRELIKYPVRAMPEKSNARGSVQGRAVPDQAGVRVDVSEGAAIERGGAGLGDGADAEGDAETQAARGGSEAAARSRSAPALTEWTAAEFLEWWNAHQGFRRTRTYGLLFDIEKPEKESLDGFKAVGRKWLDGLRFKFRSSLLNSIPGDKSSGRGYLDRLKDHLQALRGPPDGPLAMLEAAAEVEKRWQQAPKSTH